MRRFLLRLWTFLRPGRAEGELAREIESHLQLLEDDFVARGMTPAAARVAARRAFGRPDEAKELHRESRSFALLDNWRLDMRLGVRMLVKHPGLSLAGGFAMAVAIALGATSFEVLRELLDPALPFPGGARVVAFREIPVGPDGGGRDPLGELLTRDTELATIEEIGAWRSAFRNLVPRSGPPESVKVAEVTASAFSITRVPPLLGRPLLPADEREGAPPVVVIGHRAWQSRFGADPEIVGQAIQLGGAPHTIAGVMPEEFRFPYNHDYWTPLRVPSLRSGRVDGPPLDVFGRLRENVTLEEAEAELTAVASRSVSGPADRDGEILVRVAPFTLALVDLSDPRMVMLFRLGQLLIAALSFVVAVNLAILFYARTVTRAGEIAVRTALGASRGRILTQLFLEALALSLTGTAAGLGLSRLVLEVLQALGGVGGVPFWIRFDLSIATVFYALGLGVAAALVMGVLPGLKATGHHVASSLRDLSGRATRLGGVWTTLVVAQVAVAVAILPVAVYASAQMLRMEMVGAGFPAERFVVTSIFFGGEGETVDPERVRARQAELTSRIEAEPGVTAVSYTSAIPGFGGGSWIELEEGIPMREPTEDASTIYVAPDLFDLYDAEILAGRGFTAADEGEADTAIVNRRFASLLIGDRSLLGVRFRYANGEEGRWYQIVGVVDDFPAFSPQPFSETEPTIYHAAAPGELHPFFLSIRFDRDLPPGITDRIRRIGAEVDPALQLRKVVPLSTFYDEMRMFWRYLSWGVAAVTASVLLLSAAGIYAMMSFTIARRTREIGIRTALGATRARLLAAIFGRALRQLGLGLLAGSLVSGLVFFQTDFGLGRSAALLLAVAAIMLVVGVLAAVGPARRGLRIQPTEALRVEG